MAHLTWDSSFSALPSALGPYRVLHQLGAGVLGPVFRTHDERSDQLVAVKVFVLDLTPERAREFAEQLQLLVALDLRHPSLVSLLSAGVEGSLPYLAQEYVTGDPLDRAIRENGPTPVRKALQTLARLADAIDFAAAASVHHGGLHPRDVLGSAIEVRLIGCGIAAIVEDLGIKVPVRRPYGAPERLQGRTWGLAADIYALAALGYELVTGRRLGSTTELPPPGSWAGQLDPALRDVFLKALATDPHARYETAGEFVSALQDSSVKLADLTVCAAAFRGGPNELEALFTGEASAQVPELGAESVDPSIEIAEIGELGDLSFHEEELGIRQQGDNPLEQEQGDSPLEPQQGTGALDETASLSAGIAVGAARRRWPSIAAVLMFGLAAGFAGGYVAAHRGLVTWRASGGGASAATTPNAERRSREWTENAVPEPEDSPGERASANPPVEKEPLGAIAAPPVGRAAPAVRSNLESKESTGRLLIRSSPAGATVIVDGEDRGVTPRVLRDLPFADYTVRVSRPGYTSDERRVSLSKQRPSASLEFDLTRADARRSPTSGNFGTLSVLSRPSGARVFLDGRLLGITPVVLPDLHAGWHLVRLELEGYRGWASRVQVAAGGRNNVAASLERVNR